MTKRQLIDEIVLINQSARPSFLAEFADEDLQDYLNHLCLAHQPHYNQNQSGYNSGFRPVFSVTLERTAQDVNEQWRDIPDNPAGELLDSTPPEENLSDEPVDFMPNHDRGENGSPDRNRHTTTANEPAAHHKVTLEPADDIAEPHQPNPDTTLIGRRHAKPADKDDPDSWLF